MLGELWLGFDPEVDIVNEERLSPDTRWVDLGLLVLVDHVLCVLGLRVVVPWHLDGEGLELWCKVEAVAVDEFDTFCMSEQSPAGGIAMNVVSEWSSECKQCISRDATKQEETLTYRSVL